MALGQDLVGIDRFRLLYTMDDTDALSRVFRSTEQLEAKSFSDPILCLASCFAAKEAVLKTIGGLEQGIELTDVEIDGLRSVSPTVRLYGSVMTAATLLGIADYLLAISRSRTFVTAIVIALGVPQRPY